MYTLYTNVGYWSVVEVAAPPVPGSMCKDCASSATLGSRGRRRWPLFGVHSPGVAPLPVKAPLISCTAVIDFCAESSRACLQSSSAFSRCRCRYHHIRAEQAQLRAIRWSDGLPSGLHSLAAHFLLLVFVLFLTSVGILSIQLWQRQR